ncbi:P-loop containing nucleoside triphosphate hydrolase protein [Rhexocercosporidium sp. MPI-PUGE-AT-0058]|nr:P-loop containing nucleoside triphosphate hydrolase protein [Rhexocercosporidium sp. MPI-PUGE-AT-0058]
MISLLDFASRDEWQRNISGLCDLADTEIIKLVYLAVSSVLLLISFARSKDHSYHQLKAERTHPRLSIPYEICSQIARTATFIVATISASHHHSKWPTSLLFGYVFALGVFGLLFRTTWRRKLLRHADGLLIMSFVLILISDYLPSVLLDSSASTEPPRVLLMSTLGLCVLVSAFIPQEWASPSVSLDLIHRDRNDGPSPEETCSYFSYYVSYGWITNVIFKGFWGKLTLDDLPPLPFYDEPLLWLSYIQVARAKGITTLWTLIFLLRAELSKMVLCATLSAISNLIAPFAMYQLLDYLAHPEVAIVRPTLWVCLLFVGPMSRSIAFHQYIFTTTRLVVRVKISMVQELFYKAMRRDENDAMSEKIAEPQPADNANRSSLQQSSPLLLSKSGSKGNLKGGQIANLISYDVDAVVSSRDIVLCCITGPIELTIAMFLLYRMLGWSSMVGLAVMLLCFPLPTILARKMSIVHTRAMKATDTRISRIIEYLPAIRTIKYFAWEDPISEKIDEARQTEQRIMWRRGLYAIAITASGDFIPLLTLFVMFSCYTLGAGGRLTSATAFTSLSLVELLRSKFAWISRTTRYVAQGKASLRRIDHYFETFTGMQRHPEGPPSLTDATVSRSHGSNFKLRNITLQFAQHEMNVITGPSGSGKTSLLLSLLGETILESGEITCPRNVAYASQSAWLQNDTIRNNILFYSDFEQARYDRVTNACCLIEDFVQLPRGDQTLVGENGTVLSGGQRQRLALARAIYSNASTIFLDDVFSALDVTTAVYLYNYAFCSNLLRGRTVILVTQTPWIAEQADFEVRLDGGLVKSVEARKDVVRLPISVSQVLAATPISQQEASGDAIHDPAVGKLPSDPQPGKSSSDGVASHKRNTKALFYEYMVVFGGRKYALLALCTSLVSQLAFFSVTLWLSVWVGAYSNEDAFSVGYYLSTYAAVLMSFNILTGINSIVFQNGAWNAARKMHSRIVQAVFRAPLSWYDKVSTGHITNRFSRDINSVDSLLADIAKSAIYLLMRLVLRVGAIGSILPIFALPTAVVCVIGFIIGDMYTRAAASVKRIAAESQSPVFAQFSEALAGLSVVRARTGMIDAMGRDLARKLRVYARAAEAQYNLNRWVSVRTDCAAAVVALGAGSIALSRSGSVSAGIVGFSLTNAIGLSGTIISLVRNANELEIELACFQRLQEYVDLPIEEENSDSSVVAPPASWPCSGTLEFRNVTARYIPDGPDILKNISFTLKSGERVAIVGRTGSGKSTLVLSLIRVTHIVSGTILYDGIDIGHIGLKRLRQGLTIIPQDTALFSGDVGENLDPSNTVDRHDLENALRACSGIDALSNQSSTSNYSSEQITSDLSLSTQVKSGGQNFSHGQRQILSLARALVKRSKLILLDEATASMDYETDSQIQSVLREELKGSTLVTIAHRLRTVIDYDRVIVMSGGEVLEIGAPKELFEKGGVFADMVVQSQEADELVSAFTSSENASSRE